MTAMAERNGTDIVLGKQVGTGGRRVPKVFDRTIERTHVLDPDCDLFPRMSMAALQLFRRSLVERAGLRFTEGLLSHEDQLFTAGAYLNAGGVSVLADYDCYLWAARADGTSSTQVGGASTADVHAIAHRAMALVAEHTEPGSCGSACTTATSSWRCSAGSNASTSTPPPKSARWPSPGAATCWTPGSPRPPGPVQPDAPGARPLPAARSRRGAGEGPSVPPERGPPGRAAGGGARVRPVPLLPGRHHGHSGHVLRDVTEAEVRADRHRLGRLRAEDRRDGRDPGRGPGVTGRPSDRGERRRPPPDRLHDRPRRPDRRGAGHGLHRDVRARVRSLGGRPLDDGPGGRPRRAHPHGRAGQAAGDERPARLPGRGGRPLAPRPPAARPGAARSRWRSAAASPPPTSRASSCAGVPGGASGCSPNRRRCWRPARRRA